ncbi:MAG: histidine kinase [Bacteroidota bacterium]
MTKSGQSINDRLGITGLMIFRQRWWQHLLFWIGLFLILLNIFKTSGSFEKIDLIYTLIFLIPLLGITCLNLYHFIPRYLRREKYIVYLSFFGILTSGGAVFLYFLFDRWIDIILPNYYFISYYSVGQLMIYTGSVLLLTTLLKLSRSWFMLLRMERMTTSHQLKSLQSQINPHFLLNSLQTIYALSMEKSERTPDVILRLSEILKYTLYETERPQISLEQEISLISDYVEMYRYRVDPLRTDIRLDVQGEAEELRIAPMLLIPFIENCFKHGLQAGPGSSFVHIQLQIFNNILEFRASNNKGVSYVPDIDQRKGIGIENTRQRLELLYPGKHQLKILEEDKIFAVHLKLELNHHGNLHDC